jgi:hypothetical protein
MNPVEKCVEDCLQEARAKGLLGDKWEASSIEQAGASFVVHFSGPDDQGFDLQFKRREDGAAACAQTTNFSIVLLTGTPADAGDQRVLSDEDDKLLGDFLKIVETRDSEPIPDKHWRKLAAAK